MTISIHAKKEDRVVSKKQANQINRKKQNQTESHKNGIISADPIENFCFFNVNESQYLGTDEIFCAFCKSSSKDQSSLQDLGNFYGPFKFQKKQHFVHELCALWSPLVYLDQNSKFKNLIKEIKRSKKNLCRYCGFQGGGLGCNNQSCRNTYHFKCSLEEDFDCKLDFKNYLLFCPEHIEEFQDEVDSELLVFNLICQNCKKGTSEDKLIICDNCDLGYHIFCLKKKLERVPDEDWLCESCAMNQSYRQSSNQNECLLIVDKDLQDYGGAKEKQ